jgi:hypothetical protein
MRDDLTTEGKQMLEELRIVLSELKQMFAEVTRNLAGALVVTDEVFKSTQKKVPTSALPLSNEDMDARLRSIRHYITPKELARLLHLHRETVYRMVKTGMPVDRDVDGRGKGRNLKVYPPKIAEWRAQCREARKRAMQSRTASGDDSRKRLKTSQESNGDHSDS